MAIMGSDNPLVIIFGILGNLISFMVYLAPLPTFYQIYKKKCTGGFHSLPYLMSLLSSTLWLYYALLKIHDAIPLITINSIGCVIELFYIVIYITYAHKDARDSTIKLLAAMNIGSLALILCLTQYALHGSLRVKVLGWFCVVVSLFVFAAPLSIMTQVCKTKSVQFMPFPLSFFLTLSAIVWLLYGYFNKDICVTIPNVFGLVLGIAQMVLYGIYKQRQVVTELGVTNININIAAVNPLGPSEVYPVDDADADANANDNDVNDQQLKANDYPV